MKHIYTLLLFFFLLFPGFINAQEDVIYLQSGSKILSSRPDVNGNILAFDENNGTKIVLSAKTISEHPLRIPYIINKKSGASGKGTESIADMIMYPGFPDTIPNIGYNDGMEGVLFCNMDADPQQEIVINLGQTTQAINMDGSIVPGWPKTISQVPSGGPVFGDIDGDGEGEIVIGSYTGSTTGYVYAYEKNGTAVTGFPVNTGYIWMSPTLADLNNDGAMEIIVGKRQYPTGQVIVLKGDGTALTGWPQTMAGVPGASAAVGDITGDNSPEVIFEALDSLYAWDASGNLIAGFPFTIPAAEITSYSSPVLADINNDGMREIIFGTHEGSGLLRGVVHIIKNNGTEYPGWPKYTTYWVYAPPSVGYINNDNILDVAVGDQVLSGTPVDLLYAWDINGNPLTGFPISPLDAINAQTLIIDIDGDNLMELIFDNNSSQAGQGKYHAYNHDGSVVSGWPLLTQGGTFFVTPAITDINLDNVMDMIGAGSTGTPPNVTSYVSLWNAGVPYSSASVKLPMYQYNQARNGSFNNPTIVPVEMESFTAAAGGSDVQLEWITVTETNNSGFRLFRNDEPIAFVAGKGTTTEKQVYTFTDRDLTAGTYTYRLTQVDFNGTVSSAGSVTVEVGNLPEQFSLAQNYPNPFNPDTRIKYSLPVSSQVMIKVYDVLGNEIETLVNKEQPGGTYEFTWNAAGLPGGVYFYRLQAGSFSETKKTILMK